MMVYYRGRCDDFENTLSKVEQVHIGVKKKI